MLGIIGEYYYNFYLNVIGGGRGGGGVGRTGSLIKFKSHYEGNPGKTESILHPQ